ncbi:DUF202 domain-containing protein [Legionella taurinensis]|uniref:DUF202 domain-containing protein n=2 Tax=Legionella taurinensis TaxID=70611 RepID=A0A3A5L5J6_9GAMM|nr:DUF202 domain-containing protein [Legionella taurinensis]MDX1837522.1 DUF202 domain-containing protein [Legionella taurinensis]PUT40861.1 hypothetical protein DB744_06260 [Legionella taurinensis]PUT44282.1 hypothetical protein DB746_04660 [Legionella taurinensis]PUT47584.1 hypothetical protein DB743_02830 [Legionella taurinensis]PUT48723.1 hypothetical protein DB745_04660 [Legionella taurinensis]
MMKSKANIETATVRDHLANERTFLAWIRTSIGIMAFGFVVEKFSLFLRQAASFFHKAHLPLMNNVSPSLQSYSAMVGILLVALGALMCPVAFIRYHKLKKQITTGNYIPTFFFDALLAIIVFIIGVFLTASLIRGF